MFFNFIRTQYRMHKLTADQVWEAVEAGRITEEQAVTICGPKPPKE